MNVICRLGGGILAGGDGHQFGVEDWAMGFVEECALGAAVVGTAREEAAHAADTSGVQTIPHYGDSSKGGRTFVILTFMQIYSCP